MSSRALRKLQREHEEQQQLAKLQARNEEPDDEDEEVEEEPVSKPKVNAFDMLNAAIDEDEGDQSSAGNAISEGSDQEVASAQVNENTALESQTQTNAKAQAKRRPKKKGKKKKGLAKKEDTISAVKGSKAAGEQAQLDEIDLALMSLKDKHNEPTNQDDDRKHLDENLQHLYTLLAIDTKYLNALNEMKRLFGNVVLEGEGAEQAGAMGGGRRRGRGPQQVDLGGALTGRNSPISRGQGLAGLALRRNVFMLGKEEWPKATSGGLGMEVIEKAWDLTTEYRFVHNSMYQDVQRQFESCVESMDPQRMIQLLQFNPYHISTLLQVSEIAKQQGDHSVSGDLLERALFSFGRSVHSSFHTALSEGKARLDFRRRENREFWLASWRYIGSLGQRGTWRTAYEWAKLLLSLDPEEDPYCIHMILDQLALRSAQAENFVDLARSASVLFDWGKNCPNIDISLGLAESRLKRPEACRATLRAAVENYPWIFARLFQELNIGHTPKSIWGKEPRTQDEKLKCEAYVARGKDLWNTPEGVSLLVEVTESVTGKSEPAHADHPITLNQARHIMLSDIPQLISLLPREFTTSRSSASDPLPPPDDLPSYELGESASREDELFDEDEEETGASREPSTTNAEAEEYRGLQAFFSRIVPWFSRTGSLSRAPNPNERNGVIEESNVEDLARVIEDSGVDPEIFEERGARLIELHSRIAAEEQHRREVAEQEFLANDPAQRAMEEAGMSFIARGGLDDLMANIDADRFDAILRNPTNGSPNSRATPDNNTSSPADDSLPEPYDDERNQRWLAGQGMMRLRDFVTEHGTDEEAWKGDGNVDTSPLTEYARRVNLLQRQATRNFILDYSLQQGTSSEARALVIRFAEAASRGS